MTVDTIVFNTHVGDCSPTIRKNIINHFYNDEDATIVSSKANYKLNSEYAFTRKNIRFKSDLIPSYSSEINACYDEINKMIKFNFSLPKCLYGSNLFFLKNSGIRNDQLYSNYDFSFCKKIIDHSILHLSDEDFEPKSYINQIDFSINLLMQSESEALTYINQLKGIQGRWKPVKVTPYSYNYSVMWVYEHYSIKCYIKGQEMKVNKGNIHKIYTHEEIEKLLEVGMRTIRYEVSIRKEKIKEIYSKNFRKECSYFATLPEKKKNKFFNGEMLITEEDRSNYYYLGDESEMYPEHWYCPVFDHITYKDCHDFASKKVEEHMINLVKTQPIQENWNKSLKVITSFLNKGWSINEMIEENLVSRATYYRLFEKGLVPDKRQKLGLISDKIYDYPNGNYFAEAIEEFNYKLEEFENMLYY